MHGLTRAGLVGLAVAIVAALAIATRTSAQNACTAGAKAAARKGDSSSNGARAADHRRLGDDHRDADPRPARDRGRRARLPSVRHGRPHTRRAPAAGSLPAAAVLALGANGPVDDAAVRRARRTIGATRILGLVTPRKPASSASAMRRAAHRQPQRVLLIDWAAFSRGHSGWFAGDGLHVNATGARAFAHFVRRRLDPFVGPPRSLNVPASAAAGTSCASVRRGGVRLDVFALRGGDRVSCARARRLVRRGTLRPIGGWRPYDFKRVGRTPWTDIFVRHDRKVIVASRQRS